MKSRFVFHLFVVFIMTLFPFLSLVSSQANAATVVHYLPFGSSEGPVRVNATGWLYKSDYDNAGLRSIELPVCNLYKYRDYFCYDTERSVDDGEYHGKDSYSGKQRGAIDFSLGLGKKVLASADGVVARKVDNDTAANYITIKHADGTYSQYVHTGNYKVAVGQYVIRGQVIGEVVVDKKGSTTFPIHLHYALWNGIPYSGGVEIKAKFGDSDVQKHGGYVRPTNSIATNPLYKNKYTSSNSPQTPPAPTKFADGSYSALSVSLASVTLKVCSPSLTGKTVFATAHRGPANGYAAKIWRYQKVASSTCVTFSEMDGAGNTFDNVMYYTVASLVPISDADASAKRTSCWVATNHVQLCDGKSR